MSGEGRCGEAPYRAHTAIRLEPGEAARLEAATASELFCIAYPLVSARA